MKTNDLFSKLISVKKLYENNDIEQLKIKAIVYFCKVKKWDDFEMKWYKFLY